MGIDKVRKVAEKIRTEDEIEMNKNNQELAEVKNELTKVQENEELAKMYNYNSQLGSENLGGNSPTLSIYSSGKSQSKLADGSKPSDGFFYYKATKEQFKTVLIHVLSISRKFYADSMEKNPDGTTKQKPNYLLSGMLINENGENLSPFVMYINGKRISPMFEFGKEVNQYTHQKPVSIPIFALTVKLSTHEEKNDYSMSWIIDFEIVKDESGYPKVVTDMGEFTYLKDSVIAANEMTESIIRAKGKDKDEPMPVKDINVNDKDPEDIPF